MHVLYRKQMSLPPSLSTEQTSETLPNAGTPEISQLLQEDILKRFKISFKLNFLNSVHHPGNHIR